ncbi:threonine--tRNA ligase [Candidatus Shikimatogenerans bostrichidophilus]|uniref:threonine--tRNA ligase n=1 Tax=Candidatus Shikimatogenerans bostrichidophilus TaxID=2943807 RepID=UPI002966056D
MKINKLIDHKKIGNKLKLFFFSNNIGSGLPIWLPNGLYLYNKIKNFIRKINIKQKYEEILTPHIAKKKLFNKSGHLKKYNNNIFKITKKNKINYLLKPMNCPFHCEIYKNYKNITYKDLPIKYYEFGTVYRNEKSGEINGLFRTRIFTQDDAHIFCRKKNIYKIIYKIIDNIKYIYNYFNFNKIYIRFSLKDLNDKNNKKYIGDKKIWKKSQHIILKIKKYIELNNKTYIKYNEAAFYGPKIDFIIKDSLNRKWQLGTIQIDYNTPIRFNLKYIDKNNKYKSPIIIHRALLGSIERFIGILIEHTKGNIPIWLLKIQLVIIPINKQNLKYSRKIYKTLIKKKIRIIIDKKKKQLNDKIKYYEKNNIPIIIIGNKEEKNKTIFIRIKQFGKFGSFKLKQAIKLIINIIKINNKY